MVAEICASTRDPHGGRESTFATPARRPIERGFDPVVIGEPRPQRLIPTWWAVVVTATEELAERLAFLHHVARAIAEVPSTPSRIARGSRTWPGAWSADGQTPLPSPIGPEDIRKVQKVRRTRPRP